MGGRGIATRPSSVTSVANVAVQPAMNPESSLLDGAVGIAMRFLLDEWWMFVVVFAVFKQRFITVVQKKIMHATTTLAHAAGVNAALDGHVWRQRHSCYPAYGVIGPCEEDYIQHAVVITAVAHKGVNVPRTKRQGKTVHRLAGYWWRATVLPPDLLLYRLLLN